MTPVPLSPLATTSIGSGAADYLLFRRVPSPSSAVSLASSTDTLVDDEKEGDGWIDTAGGQQHHYEVPTGSKWSIGSGEPRKREASPAYRQVRAGREVWGRLFGVGAVPAALLAFAVAFVALSVAAFLLPAAGAEYPCQRPYQAQAYTDFPAFNTSRLSGKYALHLFRDPDPADGRVHRNATPEFQPTGVPAVFVPGNAGSFRQVRHLAAETMRQFAAASSESPSSGNDGLKAPIDMYTLDFGEDLTAFHGQALLDQAEYLNDAIAYILTLYGRNQGPAGGPRPRSVMLLGHSMGGVVARTVFLMPNFVPGSVETIVTFAAPHTAPPATFDADIVRAYDSVNGFWRRAFSRDSAGRNPLADVSLISIAGGHLDHMIPSNHAGVSSLVPPSNGFAVLTNSVPRVWSGIGHEEILWCDPLRRAVAAALVSVVDARSPAKVLPLDERMRMFRRRLLTGLEETAATDKTVDRQLPPPPHHRVHSSSSSSSSDQVNSRSMALPPDTRLTYGETSALTVAANDKFDILNVSRPTQGPATFLMPISDKTQLPSAALSLLSEAALLEGDFKGSDGFYVLACRFPSGAGSTGALSQVDISANAGRPRVSLLCHNLAPYAVQLPREALPSAQPAPVHTHAFSGTPQQQQGLDGIATTTTTTAMTNDNYWYLGLNATKYLEGYSYLAVVDTTHRDQHSMRRLVAQVLPDASAAHVSVGSKNAWKMWFGKGKRVVLPVDRPVKVDVSFPSVWSSLLAYRLRVVPSKLATGLQTGTGVIPVLCQSIEDPHESKFYLRAAPGSLMAVDIHGVAPFTPYSLRYADDDDDDDADSAAYHGLRIQVWSDRAHDAPVDLVLELDVVRSLGKLVLHYRTALAVLPMFVVMLVVMLQLWGYGASGVFPSFGDTLVLLSTRYLVVLLAGIAVVPYIASVPLVDRLLYVIEPWMDLDDGCGAAGTGTGRLVRRVGFFLGLEPSHLVWLGPLFMLVSLGMVQLTYYLVLLVVQPLAFAVGSIAVYRPKTARSMTARRRRIAILVVALIVASYAIPYQPAFALLFVVQAVACVRALWVFQSIDTALCDARLDVARLPDVDVERPQPLVTTTSAKPTPRIITTTMATSNKTNLRTLATLTARARNHYRYAVSLMVIFVWLLPINLPYMAVWVHNLRVNWAMTFSAQHSFLSIAPMFAVAEMCLSGKTLPRTHPAVSSRTLLTMGMLGYMAAYCLLFGIQRAYWLHHLVNLFCAWLLVLYCEADASHLCKGLGLSRFFDVYTKS